MRMLTMTHAALGYILGYLMRLSPWFFALGAVLPDVDGIITIFYPAIAHRGEYHTVLAAVIIAGLFYLFTKRKADSQALFLGYIAHLFLDTPTPLGILWSYPLSLERFSWNLVYAADLWANVALLLFYGLIYFLHIRRKPSKNKAVEEHLRQVLVILAVVGTLLIAQIFSAYNPV